MATPFLGEIKIVSFNFAPKGWALCNGQLLAINTNQPLFALFGTMYGGDGRVNFGLPNLQGQVAAGVGGGSFAVQGGRLGETTHTLSTSEMPAHLHQLSAKNADADVAAAATPPSPSVALARAYAVQSGGAHAAISLYSTGPADAAQTFSPAAVSNAGGSQPHQNMQPYLTLNFIVALQGIFPSRN
jgi:microcystin-dependent protein